MEALLFALIIVRNAYRRHAVGGELFSIKLANELLSTRAAGDGAWVHVHHQHPLVVNWVSVHRQLEQVRALPDATDCVGWN